MTRIILSAVFALSLLSGCGKTPQTDRAFTYRSFRDIPGVTKDEIRDIDALRERSGAFVYGMTVGTEAFYNNHGEIQGFSVLFCDWLTELFEIPFEMQIFDWPDLVAGLESGGIDFTGLLTATDERRKIYSMTDPIAMRLIKTYRLVDGKPLPEIIASRKPRYAFPTGTNLNDRVRAAVDYDYDLVAVSGEHEAYAALKSGDADVYFMEEIADAAFDAYGDVVGENFSPVILNPVSMSTRNSELAPVISVVQKALESGAHQYLYDMYDAGHWQYLTNLFYRQLTEIDKAQSAIDARKIESRWKNRVYDYEKKLSEKKIGLILVALGIVLVLVIVLGAILWRVLLKRKNQGAENQQKSESLAKMSHKIRTPIVGGSTLLENNLMVNTEWQGKTANGKEAKISFGETDYNHSVGSSKYRGTYTVSGDKVTTTNTDGKTVKYTLRGNNLVSSNGRIYTKDMHG
jgi:ABC-type amino acid transport substrate-binding protein/type II secretory pathway pseudopilin PulG